MIDSNSSPSYYGTGTEDFFNGGWYFNLGPFTLQMHGNTAHLPTSNTDATAAYRLFLQDAVPFRNHIRVSMQHGGTDDVNVNSWLLAYYYYQPTDRLTLSDSLIVGNAASEAAHSYTMAIPSSNAGVILRRQFDNGVANQMAGVYLNGSFVGNWYRAGKNTIHNWRQDDFLIPASFTSGKTSITIKIQFISSTADWNEFQYFVYAKSASGG